jgi:Ca-activated chloride channel homolog
MKTRLLLGAALAAAWLATPSGQQQDDKFRFKTSVELINVAATVTDRNGRFVSGLRREDFRIYEDGVEQPLTHFDRERVPVSLGIVLDTSGSMEGEKMRAANAALDRFLYDLLGEQDEVFLYRFDARPQLVAGWTVDRRRISSELRRIQPRGGTALYDAVAEALPLAAEGSRKKKAILVISDGNDTSSVTEVDSLKQMVRQSEVLLYAIGIDGAGSRIGGGGGNPGGIGTPRFPIPIPFPLPGRRNPPPSAPPSGPIGGGGSARRGDGPVNAAVLRELTDDTGGRTEIVRQAFDLDPATASIAHELSSQYTLGYPAPGKIDGRWHTIRVEVTNPNYIVRARRGYYAKATDGSESQVR